MANPPLCVDGHSPDDDTLTGGDEAIAPFYIFRPPTQDYLPGKYATRAEAEAPIAKITAAMSGLAKGEGWTIIKAVVTDEDIAETYSQMLGRPVKVGDPEYRVLDDFDNPGCSYDYPSLEMAKAEMPLATVHPSCIETAKPGDA